MTNTKLEQLTKAIQKAVPDIMELKSGCEVKVKEKLDTCSHYYNATILQGYEDCVRVYGVSIQDENLGKFEQVVEKIDIIKIIGRPITLEDVFKTLRGRDKDKRVLIAINEEGEFMEWISGWEEIDIFYDFDKSFTEQPQKTKDFIGNLIL